MMIITTNGIIRSAHRNGGSGSLRRCSNSRTTTTGSSSSRICMSRARCNYFHNYCNRQCRSFRFLALPQQRSSFQSLPPTTLWKERTMRQRPQRVFEQRQSISSSPPTTTTTATLTTAPDDGIPYGHNSNNSINNIDSNSNNNCNTMMHANHRTATPTTTRSHDDHAPSTKQQNHERLMNITVQFLQQQQQQQRPIDATNVATTTTAEGDDRHGGTTTTQQQQQQTKKKHDVAMIQHLLERWIQQHHSYTNTNTITTTTTSTTTSIDMTIRFMTVLFQQWIHYYNDNHKHHHDDDSDSGGFEQQKQQQQSPHHLQQNGQWTKEMMHYLYRILHILQQQSKQQQQQQRHDERGGTHNRTDHRRNGYIMKAYHLLQQALYMQCHQVNRTVPPVRMIISPGPKAYSMVFETLSHYNFVNDNNNHDSDYIRNDVINSDSWNRTSIIDMADVLVEQLQQDLHTGTSIHRTLAQQIPYPRQQQQQPFEHDNTNDPIATASFWDDNDITVAQNSYLRLLAQYSAGSNGQSIAKKAEQYLWNRMMQPNTKSYSAVLQAYVNAKSPECAHTLLQHMIDRCKSSVSSPNQFGIVPDRICYNICLQAFGNAGYATEAHELLLQMIQLSKRDDTNSSNNTLLQPPDVYSYLAVIKAFAKRTDNNCNTNSRSIVTEVMQVFEQMIQNNIAPNTTIYTTILNALAHESNSGPMVERTLQYMEHLHYDNNNSSSINSMHFVKPSREAYTIAIRAWGRTTNDVNAPDHATNIFHRMCRRSFIQQGNDGPISNDLSPCTISYTTLIHAWAQSYRIDAPNRALQILRYMEQQQSCGSRVIPDTITYNVVLHALAQHGLATEAHQLLNEMKVRMFQGINNNDTFIGKKEIQYPNTISWATVIQAYNKSHHSDAGMKANELLLDLEQLYDTTGIQSLQPTADIYSITILAQNWGNLNSSDSNSSSVDIAEQTFWRMIDRYQQNSTIDKNKNQPPNTSVCNALLRVWSTSNDPVAPQRAEMILRWMEDHPRHRNTTGRAQEVDEGVASLRLAPDNDSYRYVLQTWYKSKRRNAYQYINNILKKVRKQESTIHLH